MDDRVILVRFSVREPGLSLLQSVHTGSGTHPASCSLGTWVPFADWGMTLTVRFHLMLSLKTAWSYTSKSDSFVFRIGAHLPVHFNIILLATISHFLSGFLHIRSRYTLREEHI